MYFLTDQDPNFRIKGSRDPLGFQPIWQNLGRTVVRYLSTVSVNIRDFQVLSYAWFFFGDRNQKDFLPFFYRFEQAYGFARGKYLDGDAFNGIDFVKKNLGNQSFTFSNKSQHSLLSNQKSYGIFGKYNRPFTEMKLKQRDEFMSVMEESLQSKVSFDELQKKINRLLDEDEVTMTAEEIKIFADSIDILSDQEKQFYTKYLLMTEGEHVQNELFDLLNDHFELTSTDQFNLFSFIHLLRSFNLSEELKKNLIEIQHSELVLTPFAYLFKTLQNAPIWEKDKLEEQSIFESFPKSVQYPFKSEIISELNQSLSKEPFLIALQSVKRNNDVSLNRGNAAWIKNENGKLITCYSDGRRHFDEVKNGEDYEHSYFLPAYISLFKQIRKA